MTAIASTPHVCPACGATLEPVDVHPHGLLGCLSCGGTFLNHTAVRAVVSGGDFEIERRAGQFARVADRPAVSRAVMTCPFCSDAMSRIQVSTGDWVHTCDKHGSWFDAGTVARVAEARRLPQGVVETSSSRPHETRPEERAAEILHAQSTVSLWLRLVAHILDALVFVPTLVLAIVLFDSRAPFAGVVLLLLGGFAATIGWQLWSAGARGQTFGKRRVGIRVVRANGSRASAFRILFLRNVLPYYIIPLALTTAGNLAEAFGSAGDTAATLALPVHLFLLPAIFFFAGAGDLLILLPARRALHDYVAGTIVVPASWTVREA